MSDQVFKILESVAHTQVITYTQPQRGRHFGNPFGTLINFPLYVFEFLNPI